MPDAPEQSLYEAELAFISGHALRLSGHDGIEGVRRRLGLPGMTGGDRVAAGIVAPVLAGFARWIENIVRTRKAIPLGVMREGRLICGLMRELCGISAREVDLNRHLSMLAAYDAGDNEALVNWLCRTRVEPLTHAALKRLLPAHDPQPGASDRIIGAEEARRLVAQWKTLGSSSPVYGLARSAHEKIRLHWRNIVPPASSAPVALMDFACAGNIQRAVQTILNARDDATPVVGLNFLTTRGAIWAKKMGCDIRGFLAEDGNPAFIADAYTRAPEIMEVFVAAPVGPLVDYDGNGHAVRGAYPLPRSCRDMVVRWQSLVLKSAKMYYDALRDELTPDLCGCIWTRLLLNPLPSEIAALADWPVDGGLNGDATGPLAPPLDGNPRDWTRPQTRWPAASLLRRQAGL